MPHSPVPAQAPGSPCLTAGVDPGSPWQLFILLLSVAAVTGAASQTLGLCDAPTARILLVVDFVACLIFLGDFVAGLARAPSVVRYLRWGWIDLLSSVPLLVVLRWGRLVRVARILLLLRGARSLRSLGRQLLRRRAEATFLLGGLVALVLVALGAVAMLHLERTGAGATIDDSGDALWWAVATVSTVGYGDVYPVSGGGRVVAAVLMLVGTTLFGVFTGFVSSWFQRRREGDDGPEIAALQREIRELRGVVERALAGGRGGGGGGGGEPSAPGGAGDSAPPISPGAC